MPNRAILAAALMGLLAGCGGFSDSFNPFGWFRRAEPAEALVPVEAAAIVDNRPLMAQVVALEIERTPGGAIVRATGLPPTQGWWEGALVSDTGGAPVDGVLAYTFRAFPPVGPTRVSTPQSREVIVGLVLSRQDLEGVREIRVRAAQNALAARR